MAARQVTGILTDEDIEKELARLRDRNIAAELATQKVRKDTRRQNRICRERYEKQHEAQLKRELQNSLAHLKVFGNRYDNSPFRHNIVALVGKREAKKAAEAKQDALYKATYDYLDRMTGRADEYIVNWADKKTLDSVLSSPVNKDILNHKQTLLDQQVLKEELKDLKVMLKCEMDTVLDKFNYLEKAMGPQPRARDTVRPSVVEYARAYLAGNPLPSPDKPSTLSPSASPLSRPASKGRSRATTPNAAQTLPQLLAHAKNHEHVPQGHHNDDIEHDLNHRIHHDLQHHIHNLRFLSMEKATPHKITAGSAVIKLMGADGYLHRTHMNYDELEGKIDHTRSRQEMTKSKTANTSSSTKATATGG